jgi:hypothetical protein
MIGHDDFVHYERTRLFLRCERCERETVGWQTGNEERREPRAELSHWIDVFLSQLADGLYRAHR